MHLKVETYYCACIHIYMYLPYIAAVRSEKRCGVSLSSSRRKQSTKPGKKQTYDSCDPLFHIHGSRTFRYVVECTHICVVYYSFLI